MPAVLKDVSILTDQSARNSAYDPQSLEMILLSSVLCASNAKPSDKSGSGYGEVTWPLLLALHDQLRFAGLPTFIQPLILYRSGQTRFAERTFPLLVQCNMYLHAIRCKPHICVSRAQAAGVA